jgi:hypothetical protein
MNSSSWPNDGRSLNGEPSWFETLLLRPHTRMLFLSLSLSLSLALCLNARIRRLWEELARDHLGEFLELNPAASYTRYCRCRGGRRVSVR